MSNHLPILAAEIRRAHTESCRASASALERAVLAGERLIEAKGHLAHGEWLPWLKEHCDLPARTARQYMRLARNKEAIEAKTATVANLTVRNAVAEIAERRAEVWLPTQGYVRVGVRENDGGWDEIWVAPSLLHPGFLFITHLSTPTDSVCIVTGCRKPVRDASAGALINALFKDDLDGFNWHDWPCGPWGWNLLLFDDLDGYFDSMKTGSSDDLRELAELAGRRVNSRHVAPILKASMRRDEASARPFIDVVAGWSS